MSDAITWEERVAALVKRLGRDPELEELLAESRSFCGGREYHVVELPEWDRSPLSVKTFDIEMRCGDDWLEVSSISNMGANQSRPAQIRFRRKPGMKPECTF